MMAIIAQMENVGGNTKTVPLRKSKRMDKQNYTPDRTWKNVWAVLRPKRNKTLILTCKECPEGVSPKEKKYISIISFLCYTLGFILTIVLQAFVFPEEWCKTVKALLSILALMISCLPLAAIPVLLSFNISRWWGPANQSNSFLSNHSQSVCK